MFNTLMGIFWVEKYHFGLFCLNIPLKSLLVTNVSVFGCVSFVLLFKGSVYL